MPSDHPLDRPRGRRPVARDDRAPAPVHRGRELDFTDNPGREYWWDQLHRDVRTQLLAQVGAIIEWWAYVHDDQPDRPYAVVFGQQGFALTKPSINEQGRPASRLLVWSLRESSHRSTRVAGGSARSGKGTAARAAAPDPVTLPADFRGFLGNLPAEAQQQLQQPFTSGDLVRECDYHYYGYPERLDVWCFLAGARTVTFASGTGLRHPGRWAHTWDLVCRQAAVATGP